jgi:hypothetical protein
LITFHSLIAGILVFSLMNYFQILDHQLWIESRQFTLVNFVKF